MECIKDICTRRPTGRGPNWTLIETVYKRILQSATSLSFWNMYKSPEIATQERNPGETFDHALAANDEGASSNTLGDATAYSFLASLELGASMREMAREKVEFFTQVGCRHQNLQAQRKLFYSYSRGVLNRSTAA